MEYSSFLLRDKDTQNQENEEEVSPTREEYKQGLLKALSRSRGRRQRGVLSFRPTAACTPSSSMLEFILSAIIIRPTIVNLVHRVLHFAHCDCFQ